MAPSCWARTTNSRRCDMMETSGQGSEHPLAPRLPGAGRCPLCLRTGVHHVSRLYTLQGGGRSRSRRGHSTRPAGGRRRAGVLHSPVHGEWTRPDRGAIPGPRAGPPRCVCPVYAAVAGSDRSPTAATRRRRSAPPARRCGSARAGSLGRDAARSSGRAGRGCFRISLRRAPAMPWPGSLPQPGGSFWGGCARSLWPAPSHRRFTRSA